MNLSDLLKPEAVIPCMKAQGKKQVLQELAAIAAGLTGLPEKNILDTIQQREKLGSTGVGHGVAIPHGKLPGIEHMTGVFARLVRPVEFESLDDQPVDLVFLLLAPESAGADHLKALARVARLLRDPEFAKDLRATNEAAGLALLLAPVNPQSSDALA
ncbi:PTS IIA-like nitrogen-regulatory protein PtsN [Faunimonas pinastri]|uniref:PTS IIA-like nitrogen-regulatory protein PtsN n=1 Tax=Faunimonas pinastri TaxID=1855383 RepID=A0A1H9ITT5_9HYPH|nr:PTS IIA-like nitrogen regulatory protein PtsN [Faunimonas pinastri]SEQ77956.1 PTS IIA-like nitrogen-regulatory protein PtsN [Faunimonas pinastri]